MYENCFERGCENNNFQNISRKILKCLSLKLWKHVLYQILCYVQVVLNNVSNFLWRYFLSEFLNCTLLIYSELNIKPYHFLFVYFLETKVTYIFQWTYYCKPSELLHYFSISLTQPNSGCKMQIQKNVHRICFWYK